MKEKYVLLNKEYSSESLYDLDRDVSEIHTFPEDQEYSLIENEEDNGFLGGHYIVTVTYFPGEGDKLKK